MFWFLSPTHGGGTVELIHKLAKAQSQRGHEVSIYTGDFKFDETFAKSFEPVRVTVFRSWLNFGFLHHARPHH